MILLKKDCDVFTTYTSPSVRSNRFLVTIVLAKIRYSRPFSTPLSLIAAYENYVWAKHVKIVRYIIHFDVITGLKDSFPVSFEIIVWSQKWGNTPSSKLSLIWVHSSCLAIIAKLRQCNLEEVIAIWAFHTNIFTLISVENSRIKNP